MTRAMITTAMLLATIAAGGPVAADSVFEVEHARAKERAGYYLNDQDVEALQRWGGESRWRRGYDYYDGPAYGYYGYAPPPPPRYYRRYYQD